MNIEQLTELFKWMTLINIGLLLFSTITVMVFRPLMLKIHMKIFGITETQISVAAYAYLGLFKVLIIVFNIVPYIAISLIN